MTVPIARCSTSRSEATFERGSFSPSRGTTVEIGWEQLGWGTTAEIGGEQLGGRSS